MSTWQYVLKSLLFHRRVNLAVALGIAAATAVLTGALLVGDSMRNSLRGITLDRLGRIDEVLISDLFFREKLASELSERSAFQADYDLAIPAIYLPGGTSEPQPVLDIEKVVPRDIQVGRPASIRLIVKNDGAIPAYRVTVFDEIPTGSNFESAKPNPSSHEGGRLTWYLGTIQPGATAEIAIELLPQQQSEIVSVARVEFQRRQISDVTVIGCRQDFWKLGNADLAAPDLERDQVIINQQLADELGLDVKRLDPKQPPQITLRIAQLELVSPDSPIGKREGNVESIPRLKVVKVLPNESIARFGLQPTQLMPSNAFVSMDLLQDILGQREKVNTIFVAGKSMKQPPGEEASRNLRNALHPTLDDTGLLLRHAVQQYQTADETKTAFEYYSLSSQRMMLDPETDRVLEQALTKSAPEPILTYLANRIEIAPSDEKPTTGAEYVPFSMVTAIQFGERFAPISIDGQPITNLADDEIVLNSWAADDLAAKVGDTIRLTYFEPETTHGHNVERQAEFKLRAIAKLVEPIKPYFRDRAAVYEQRPPLANDPELTPFVPGVTDRESIENWDLPFETPGIRIPKDDIYWKNHRTTPKAFVSLATGRRLWSSRFGGTTSLRIESLDVSEVDIAEQINQQAAASDATLGLSFLAVKRTGLKASSGSTPFDALFLSLSFFIIASAVMLVTLLFRLGLEQRSNELGVLAAVGLSRGKLAKYMILEGTLVAAIGGALGVVVGIAYAYLILVGLTTVWVQAIVTPFLHLSITAQSLLIGFISGILICVATIAVTVLRTRLQSVRLLLAGKLEEATVAGQNEKSWLPLVLIAGCLILALSLSVTAVFLPGGEAQAGAFVGSGFVLLTGLLLWMWRGLKSKGLGQDKVPRLGLLAVAFRNASRKPGRSTLTIGLVAIATFLIVAISSFHLSPTEQGTGGFEWVAMSDRPLFTDLNDVTQRKKLFGDDAADWEIGHVLPFRLKPGADASCNNPYQITQPRMLGMTSADVEYFAKSSRGGFAWAGTTATNDQQRSNPWTLLDTVLDDDQRIPVVIDKNTAMYSLKIFSVGQDFELTYDDTRPIKFRVVGFLANSVLQGSLIVSEQNFEKLFPQISGYRYFLISRGESVGENSDLGPNAKANIADKASETLSPAEEIESGLSEYGVDLQSSRRILDSLLAVQNTYLKAFQSLGSLGLLLGTFGLATVQMRNVFERRGELGLLSAVGFPKPRLARLVLLEHTLLLFGGLLIGIVAAFFSVLPHMVFGDANVPWIQLIFLLVMITVVGLLAGMLAVRSTLRTPILSALRGE